MAFVWSLRLIQWSLAIAACTMSAGAMSCVAQSRRIAPPDDVCCPAQDAVSQRARVGARLWVLVRRGHYERGAWVVHTESLLTLALSVDVVRRDPAASPVEPVLLWGSWWESGRRLVCRAAQKRDRIAS